VSGGFGVLGDHSGLRSPKQLAGLPIGRVRGLRRCEAVASPANLLEPGAMQARLHRPRSGKGKSEPGKPPNRVGSI
jgi:hypothetical protein